MLIIPRKCQARERVKSRNMQRVHIKLLDSGQHGSQVSAAIVIWIERLFTLQDALNLT